MALRRRRAVAVDVDADADAVLRLAVLLRAGIMPAAAWRYLADGGDPVAGDVVGRLRAGDDVATAVAAAGGAWREIAAAWRIAEIVGAPLAESLHGIAGALTDAQRTREQVRVALAEPAGSARLMAWLPLAALGLGAVLGFDTLRVLCTTPAGIGCAVAGFVLVVAASRWTRRLVHRADPGRAVPGIRADLMAIAVSGGVSLERAADLVADAGVPEDADMTGILSLSRAAGVPAAGLLRASAALARARARTEGRVRAARLSSRLLIPLGVCTLPAFLLLGVAPLLLSVLATTRLTL